MSAIGRRVDLAHRDGAIRCVMQATTSLVSAASKAKGTWWMLFVDALE